MRSESDPGYRDTELVQPGEHHHCKALSIFVMARFVARNEVLRRVPAAHGELFDVHAWAR